jgi:phosphatidylinositol glycan class T
LAPDLYFFVPPFAASAKAGHLSEMVSRMSAKIRGRSQEPPKSPSDSSPLMNSKLILNVLFVAALAVAWRYILNDNTRR